MAALGAAPAIEAAGAGQGEGPLELAPDQVEARFQWARRHGHPEYLWPDVAPDSWRSALREIQRVTGAVLASGRPHLAASGATALRALGIAGHTSGMGPLLGHWIGRGQVDADPAVRQLFQLHLRHGRLRAQRLRDVLNTVGSALAHLGIPTLAVKSAHSAVAYFPEPGARPAIDVDLVVPRGRFDDAEEALQRLGYTAGAREMRPRKTTWLPPDSSRLPRSLELLHADSQYAVDLHSSLERNFFGVRNVRPTLAPGHPGVNCPQLGPHVRVLPQPELLLFHALHASEGLHNLTLVRLVELVLIIRCDQASGSLDWGAFQALVRDREAGRFCYPALALAERLAPGTVHPGVLEELERAATPRTRRVVARLSPAEAQRLDGLWLGDSFMWCSGPIDYVRRGLHMLLPAPVGRSLPRLLRQYRDRLYRLLRRRVFIRFGREPLS